MPMRTPLQLGIVDACEGRPRLTLADFLEGGRQKGRPLSYDDWQTYRAAYNVASRALGARVVLLALGEPTVYLPRRSK